METEYFVRQVVDAGREFWALLDRRCLDGWCEEEDVKAVAGSRPELELKMAAMGLRFGAAGKRVRMTAAETWTSWSVRKEPE